MSEKKDELQFGTVLGAQVEPEETPTRRVTDVDADVADRISAQTLGQMAGQVTQERRAIDFANQFKGMCGLCKHHDVPAAQKLLAAAENSINPAEQREYALTLADAVQRSGLDGAKADLASIGICQRMTEILYGAPFLSHPTACCPPQIQAAVQPVGFFEARDRASEKKSAETYDKILKAAKGDLQ